VLVLTTGAGETGIYAVLFGRLTGCVHICCNMNLIMSIKPPGVHLLRSQRSILHVPSGMGAGEKQELVNMDPRQ
jgi:hypothetical protein